MKYFYLILAVGSACFSSRRELKFFDLALEPQVEEFVSTPTKHNKAKKSELVERAFVVSIAEGDVSDDEYFKIRGMIFPKGKLPKRAAMAKMNTNRALYMLPNGTSLALLTTEGESSDSNVKQLEKVMSRLNQSELEELLSEGQVKVESSVGGFIFTRGPGALLGFKEALRLDRADRRQAKEQQRRDSFVDVSVGTDYTSSDEGLTSTEGVQTEGLDDAGEEPANQGSPGILAALSWLWGR